MIHGKYRSKTGYRRFDWKLGDVFPEELDFDELILTKDWTIVCGSDTKHIFSKYFTNVPSSVGPRVVYTGGMAKFIIVNLFVLWKEGILYE